MPPTYDYCCPACDGSFSDVKGIRAYDVDPNAHCPHCNHVCGSADRDFSNCKFHFTGTAVSSAEYNPGLGCVVKNKAHKEDILKAKGLVEVGNDFSGGEKMQTSFDQDRAERRERAWKNEFGENT